MGRCQRRRVLPLESGLTAQFDSESSRLFGAVAAGKAQINTGKYVHTLTLTDTHIRWCVHLQSPEKRVQIFLFDKEEICAEYTK